MSRTAGVEKVAKRRQPREGCTRRGDCVNKGSGGRQAWGKEVGAAGAEGRGV